MSCLKKRLSPSRKIILLAVVAAGVVVCSFLIGRYPLSLKEIAGILTAGFFSAEPFWSDQAQAVLINVRAPRVLTGCLVGCSLSAAGAAYQGVFQNPMASPDILGASSGAAFGAALALLCGAGGSAVVAGAFFFSLLCTGAAWLISRKTQGRQILALILSGIVVGSLFTAATSLVKLVADPTDQLPAITYWLMGSLAGSGQVTLLFSALIMSAGLIPLFLLRWKINVLTLGDEEAWALGVNARRLRLVIVFCASLITAAAVSISGIIGWVGLVVPHMARRLVGSNYRYLMPASMLLGAAFLPLVDDVARNVTSSEIPIGILTAFIGAPFFLYLITAKGETA